MSFMSLGSAGAANRTVALLLHLQIVIVMHMARHVRYVYRWFFINVQLHCWCDDVIRWQWAPLHLSSSAATSSQSFLLYSKNGHCVISGAGATCLHLLIRALF